MTVRQKKTKKLLTRIKVIRLIFGVKLFVRLAFTESTVALGAQDTARAVFSFYIRLYSPRWQLSSITMKLTIQPLNKCYYHVSKTCSGNTPTACNALSLFLYDYGLSTSKKNTDVAATDTVIERDIKSQCSKTVWKDHCNDWTCVVCLVDKSRLWRQVTQTQRSMVPD